MLAHERMCLHNSQNKNMILKGGGRAQKYTGLTPAEYREKGKASWESKLNTDPVRAGN